MHRDDIDGLRALAVVPVVLFHAGLGFPGGFVGVDVFFVISGFLITGILRREMAQGRFSILSFYERRIRRLFPALFVMMAAALAWSAAFMTPRDAIEVGQSAGAATVFLSNLRYWMAFGYFNEAALTKPLLHTWSLAVEEQFYIVLPPLLLALHALAPRRITLALAALAAASLLLSALTSGTAPEAAYYLPLTRAWELLLGALVAAAAGDPRLAALPRPAAEALGIGGVAAILWAALRYSEATVFPGWAALAPCLGAAALLVAGAARQDTLCARALSLRPLVWIGLISYSLYLWHWPVLAWAHYGRIDPLSPAGALGCVALSVGLAWASWRYVERPFRTGRAARGRRAAFGFGGAAMAAALAASGALVLAEGIPGKLPAEIAALAPPAPHPQQGCHGADVARIAAGDLCLRGAEGVPASFVLAGDSHAGAISHGVFAAAEAAGLAGYQVTSAAAHMLPGMGRFAAAPPPQNAAFSDWLRARPQIRTVALTGFWLHYVRGITYRHPGNQFRDAGYDGSGLAYNPRAVAAGLRRLAAAHPQVRFLVLDDAPSGAALDLHAFTRWRLFHRDAPLDAYGLPRAEAEAQRAAYVPVLQEAAAAAPNMEHVALPLDALCGPKICPLFTAEGRALYRDGDHLSAEGALALAPVLRDALFPPR